MNITQKQGEELLSKRAAMFNDMEDLLRRQMVLEVEAHHSNDADIETVLTIELAVETMFILLQQMTPSNPMEALLQKSVREAFDAKRAA